MIKTIALNMAKTLASTLDLEENIEIYAYALQLVFMLVLNLALVLLVAFLLEIIPTTLAFLLVFIPFRAVGGGVHLSTFPRCITIGSFLMLGSAYLATEVYIQPYQLDILFLFTLLLVLLSTVRWVPASTEKNPINDSGIVRMQKCIMLAVIGIWTSCVYIFNHSNHNTLAFAIIIAAIVSTVLISPLGFHLMGSMDTMLNKLGKGVIIS